MKNKHLMLALMLIGQGMLSHHIHGAGKKKGSRTSDAPKAVFADLNKPNEHVALPLQTHQSPRKELSQSPKAASPKALAQNSLVAQLLTQPESPKQKPIDTNVDAQHVVNELNKSVEHDPSVPLLIVQNNPTEVLSSPIFLRDPQLPEQRTSSDQIHSAAQRSQDLHNGSQHPRTIPDLTLQVDAYDSASQHQNSVSSHPRSAHHALQKDQSENEETFKQNVLSGSQMKKASSRSVGSNLSQSENQLAIQLHEEGHIQRSSSHERVFQDGHFDGANKERFTEAQSLQQPHQKSVFNRQEDEPVAFLQKKDSQDSSDEQSTRIQRPDNRGSQHRKRDKTLSQDRIQAQFVEQMHQDRIRAQFVEQMHQELASQHSSSHERGFQDDRFGGANKERFTEAQSLQQPHQKSVFNRQEDEPVAFPQRNALQGSIDEQFTRIQHPNSRGSQHRKRDKTLSQDRIQAQFVEQMHQDRIRAQFVEQMHQDRIQAQFIEPMHQDRIRAQFVEQMQQELASQHSSSHERGFQDGHFDGANQGRFTEAQSLQQPHQKSVFNRQEDEPVAFPPRKDSQDSSDEQFTRIQRPDNRGSQHRKRDKTLSQDRIQAQFVEPMHQDRIQAQFIEPMHQGRIQAQFIEPMHQGRIQAQFIEPMHQGRIQAQFIEPMHQGRIQAQFVEPMHQDRIRAQFVEQMQQELASQHSSSHERGFQDGHFDGANKERFTEAQSLQQPHQQIVFSQEDAPVAFPPRKDSQDSSDEQFTRIQRPDNRGSQHREYQQAAKILSLHQQMSGHHEPLPQVDQKSYALFQLRNPDEPMHQGRIQAHIQGNEDLDPQYQQQLIFQYEQHRHAVRDNQTAEPMAINTDHIHQETIINTIEEQPTAIHQETIINTIEEQPTAIHQETIINTIAEQPKTNLPINASPVTPAASGAQTTANSTVQEKGSSNHKRKSGKKAKSADKKEAKTTKLSKKSKIRIKKSSKSKLTKNNRLKKKNRRKAKKA